MVWETGLKIQLPPGVFFAYPSSLFYHFNHNLKGKPASSLSKTSKCSLLLDAEVVCTNGEVPTKDNCRPLSWKDDHFRGSCVWFNQATMFQSAEVGVDTLKHAKELGLNTTCDNDVLRNQGIDFLSP